MGKSTIDGEATSIRNRRAIRGGWEQRALKVESGTWDIPSDGLAGSYGGLVQLNTGMNNRGGSFGKSDGAIVVMMSG
jgi:hypothetical protein